ncbi:peroxiredoxin-5, mitochondrial-like [Gigantopelta aegis]|uniref:peroxiredoxin-5, mitochondrial-like n=1 Tax=Gigantopelta aegis TaxID=1735272 RepID=UPI001B88AB2E|nr:peroxiredoxin-5, mitochondrial-like [Gigantopelta aegis]
MASLCNRVAKTIIKQPFNAAFLQTVRFIKVGEPLPDVDLYEGTPTNKVNIRQLYKGKRGVLFSVVGAFTPGCTQSHLPEYLSVSSKFVDEGYDLITCVSVNDPFVMSAWGQSLKAEGKIRMLADPRCEFTKALGMELDCTKLLGGWRSRRYSVVVDDGVIRQIIEDPDNTGLVCLLCIKNMKAQDANLT